jgi:hypothetical protein
MNRQDPSEIVRDRQEIENQNLLTPRSDRAGIPPEESLQQHRDALLDQVIAKSLPKKELYEMKGGLSVLVSDKAYANLFKEVCLEQNELLQELAQDESIYVDIRKALKATRKKYVAKCNYLCFLLKKRLDRYDTDSDEEYQPSKTKHKIQRS